MPSCARLVATATMGMPAICAANLVTSMVLPPPIPATASYAPARSLLPSDTALSRLPSVIRKISASPISSSAAMLSPWPGPTATATRPCVAMRRSASSLPRPQIAPGPGAGHGGRQLLPSRQHRSGRPRHDPPGRRAPGSHLRSTGRDRAARSLPERPQAVQQPAGAEDYLHLLVGELLDVVDRENGVRLPATVAYPRGEQRLLDADRVHGVPVDQQHALAEALAGEPERVGIVPLLRPGVVHQLDGDAMPVLEVGYPVRNGPCRVADDNN